MLVFYVSIQLTHFLSLLDFCLVFS